MGADQSLSALGATWVRRDVKENTHAALERKQASSSSDGGGWASVAPRVALLQLQRQKAFDAEKGGAAVTIRVDCSE